MGLFKRANAVAIDGPAGSGKSTISRLVASKLGYVYIDTGAMYRALTLKAMKSNVAFDDEEAIIELSRELELELLPPEGADKPIGVILDGEDVTEKIRTMEVTVNVKHVCKIPQVRRNLVNMQRDMARDMNGTVMEGRDIGTVVLPHAKYKFYLDASFDERVSRRFAELKAKGYAVTKEEIANDLKQRDHTDKTREVGPLKKAEDAIFVDTTDLTIKDVVVKIVNYVNED